MKSLTRQLKRVFGLRMTREVGGFVISKVACFQKPHASPFLARREQFDYKVTRRPGLRQRLRRGGSVNSSRAHHE
jgi:hypothetical protein